MINSRRTTLPDRCFSPRAVGRSCSNLPSEFKADLPAHYPAKLPYALHLRGIVPFEDMASPVTERGKDMEPVGRARLERKGFKILAIEPRIVHRSMRALAYPDVIASFPDESEEGPVELKVVDAPDFRDRWNGEPPVIHQLQLQAQMACSGHRRGFIAALVLVRYGLELHTYPFERDEKIIESLEFYGQEFLDLIAREPAELLAEKLVEEDSPSSYQAWSRIIQLPKGTVAAFGHSEAVERAKRLHEARRLKGAYETIAEAETNWFAKHAPIAQTLELLDGTTIVRTVVETPEKEIPAHVRPARQHVTLKVKPAGEENSDGA